MKMLILAIIGYLIGSIPFALVIGKSFISRTFGSTAAETLAVETQGVFWARRRA